MAENLKTFLANTGDIARVATPQLLTVKSTDDNELLVIEVDPATGSLPVTANVTVPPIQYVRNGVDTSVETDSVTPANTRPLPVALYTGEGGSEASFGAGSTDAETQRVVLANDQTVPVSGPLTDAELRATAVPVSGPLTDTELRATPVPVSGPLTDTELRAVPVEVDVTASVLPPDAATETTLSSIDASALSIAVDADATATSTASIDTKTPALVSGRVPVTVANMPTTLDTNTGNPSGSTIRVAAMIGLSGSAVSSTNPVPVTSGNGASAIRLTSATQLPYFQDFSLSPLGTTYTEIISSSLAIINKFFSTNNSSTPILIATGAAASEVVRYIVMPGENAMDVPLAIASGTRISIAAQTGTISSGQFSLNAFG